MQIPVQRLCECIYTKIGSSGVENLIAQENLVKTYNLPFSFEMIDQVFAFAGDLIWEGYQSRGEKYTMLKQQDKPLFLPKPKNVSDFINDNIRYWNLPLYWEPTLTKHLFDCKRLGWVGESTWDNL